MNAVSSSAKAPNDNWWRGGVVYQIYPRSYADANGDGCGDLRGITSKLPYVASLGVDAIWLSPIFKSPMKDFGYDVSDYCDIDPLFGTLDDFRVLVKTAHDLGIKVMIDQVLSHTSDQHVWFTESRTSRTNAKRDWYVWSHAKPDGTPPNNWLSVFGGSAWQWDTARKQYYFHNFLSSQPDLNFHNVEVQNALLDCVRFWLELGVDGYRLDTANFYFHDIELRDNPPRALDPNDEASLRSNTYEHQWHVFDRSRPENLVFLKRLRALVDEYPNTAMVGEIGCDDSLSRIAEYTQGGDKLHMAYSFDLLSPAHSAEFLHSTFSTFLSKVGDGWPSWAIANHDVVRVATRWNGSPAALRAAAALQMTVRGTPCMYQGDELGLPEANVPYDALRDPVGITMWPANKGRDGCRTPMPWDGAASDAGFGCGATMPWLPISDAHRACGVAQQERDASALLHFYRALLKWRKTIRAVIEGDMKLLNAHPQILAFTRTYGAQTVLIALNFSDAGASMPVTNGATLDGTSPFNGATISDGVLTLGPWGVAALQLR